MQRRNRVRLVMCERGEGGMVEAVVQFGDDQDVDSSNFIPHEILPLLPNTVSEDSTNSIPHAILLSLSYPVILLSLPYPVSEPFLISF
jgi:hypothetical protein